ncbi:MAG: hypothetical protein CML33_09010 [Rhodobacteraceae bacterium]|nr:hypothetical protein [Paracoccaceae bacterium]
MRALFFICGFTLPFPMFIDIHQWELVIHRLYEDGYLVHAGMPVPVGVFSSALIFALGAAHGLRRRFPQKTWFYFGAALLSMISFALYASWSLTIPRVLSLMLPTASCICLALFLAVPALVLASLRGFLLGLFAVLLLHTASALYELVNYYEGNAFLFSSFFGFQIYQALISYSAILSILVCASLYHALIIRRKRLAFQMLIMAVLALFLVILGQRKAFVMDLALMTLCFFLYLTRSVFARAGFSFTSLLTAGSLLSISALTLIFSFRDRSEDLLGSALEQRGGLYVIFVNKLRSGGLEELLFGFEPGWGGYSNLFIEMILRLGFVGLSLYLVSILYSVKLTLTAAARLTANDSIDFIRGSRRPLWLFFVLSTIAANIINMNLQLPFYTINLIFIFLLFFLLKSVVNKA